MDLSLNESSPFSRSINIHPEIRVAKYGMQTTECCCERTCVVLCLNVLCIAQRRIGAFFGTVYSVAGGFTESTCVFLRGMKYVRRYHMGSL